MSHTDPEPAGGDQEDLAVSPQDLYRQAFGELMKTIAPWFFELGVWVFGGLIGFTLLILGPLITVGPVDSAVLVAIAAFALALPLDVAGLFVLRLVQDMQRVGLEDEVARAFGQFEQVGPAVGAPTPPPSTSEAQRERRTERVLRTSFFILALSGVLAVIGMVAMLWHIAWWIAIAFLAMVVISLVIVSAAMAAAQPRGATEVQEQRRRHREQQRGAREAAGAQAQQAQARDRANDERA